MDEETKKFVERNPHWREERIFLSPAGGHYWARPGAAHIEEHFAKGLAADLRVLSDTSKLVC